MFLRVKFYMKKSLCLLSFVFFFTMAMGQQVIDGVYQGSPTSFMYLPSTPPAGGWGNSWIKPSYEGIGTGSTFNFTNHMGVDTSENFSHRFVVRGSDPTVSPTDDDCFRQLIGCSFFNYPVLAGAWNSGLYPGTFVDTVIQMGKTGPFGTNTSGCFAQQIIYSFVPDTNNPMLLLNFAFVTEDGQHNYLSNPAVEFSVLNHSDNYASNSSYLDLGNYDSTHQYSRYWYRTPSGANHFPEDPDNTPINTVPQYVAVSDYCPTQNPGRPVATFPYTTLSFDLSTQAMNHQAVDFRVRVNSCTSRFHWAYCYFTAKMVPITMQVQYCGGDTLELNVPWGFDVNSDVSYKWYNGTDSSNCAYFDPENSSNASGPRVYHGSNKYHLLLYPDMDKPYYRCEVLSNTGIPYIYEATVDYQELLDIPDFLSDASSCVYPNPTSSDVILDLSGQNAGMVELFSANGQLLNTVAPTDETMILSLSNYAAGIYFVRIHSDKAVSTQKIIKR